MGAAVPQGSSMHAGTAYNNKKTSRIHQKTPDEVSDMMKGRCCSHEMKGLMWTTQKEKKTKKKQGSCRNDGLFCLPNQCSAST